MLKTPKTFQLDWKCAKNILKLQHSARNASSLLETVERLSGIGIIPSGCSFVAVSLVLKPTRGLRYSSTLCTAAAQYLCEQVVVLVRIGHPCVRQISFGRIVAGHEVLKLQLMDVRQLDPRLS
jgi:hypothetical protein